MAQQRDSQTFLAMQNFFVIWLYNHLLYSSSFLTSWGKIILTYTLNMTDLTPTILIQKILWISNSIYASWQLLGML